LLGRLHNSLAIHPIWEGKLYCCQSNSNSIIALDLSTGQLLQSWHTLPTGTTLGPQQSTVLPNPAHSVLHEEAGKILGLTGYYYWEIDLQTGALQAQDCTSGFKSQRLRAMTRPVCQGDHLYFSSDEVFERPDGTLGHDIKLAAFNWRTRKIDWEWAFDHPGEGLYQIGMPKVQGDYLAAANTGGQLHLFKKTS
jgi:outer membrane protein assembly factor BamB